METTVLLNVAMLAKANVLYDNSDLIVAVATTLTPNALDIYKVFKKRKLANADKKSLLKNKVVRNKNTGSLKRFIFNIEKLGLLVYFESSKDKVDNQERSQNADNTIMEKQQEKCPPANAEEQ